MRRARPNKQGYLDALCGIYALTNHLRDLRFSSRNLLNGDHEERSETAFWMLLDTADRLRMLNVDYLLTGYASHHLVRIWNTLSQEADLQSEAVLFSKLRRLGTSLSNFDVIKNLFDENRKNSALILHEGHWLLSQALDQKSRIAVADSANKGDSCQLLTKTEVDGEEIDGFAILVEGSKILKSVREEL